MNSLFAMMSGFVLVLFICFFAVVFNCQLLLTIIQFIASIVAMVGVAGVIIWLSYVFIMSIIGCFNDYCEHVNKNTQLKQAWIATKKYQEEEAITREKLLAMGYEQVDTYPSGIYEKKSAYMQIDLNKHIFVFIGHRFLSTDEIEFSKDTLFGWEEIDRTLMSYIYENVFRPTLKDIPRFEEDFKFRVKECQRLYQDYCQQRIERIQILKKWIFYYLNNPDNNELITDEMRSFCKEQLEKPIDIKSDTLWHIERELKALKCNPLIKKDEQ